MRFSATFRFEKQFKTSKVMMKYSCLKIYMFKTALAVLEKNWSLQFFS